MPVPLVADRRTSTPYLSAAAACLAAGTALLAAFAPAPASAEERPTAPAAAAPNDERQPPRFLRLSRDEDDRPLSLDTSIVEYAPAGVAAPGRHDPVRVDLVAAVHVGDAAYYETLDRLFTGYDVVLYELVAPPNARVPTPGRRPAGAIGSAQQGLKSLLGLEFQLDTIDYTAANFVHADLSPKEFDAAMARRGETWWSMFMRLVRESMAQAEHRGRDDVRVDELFGMLFGSSGERQLRLRRLMAEQFSDVDVLNAALAAEEGSTIITDRNAAAVEVLRKQIAAGKRRIAIFYGAAHMDDFDRRLREDFGLEPGETSWLEAWNLRAQPAAPAAAADRK